MSSLHPLNRCRMCGATSYRQVIDRDGAGAMRATGLYRCTGCSVVFADPRAWRDGGDDVVPGPAPCPAPARTAHSPIPPPREPDLRTYGMGPGSAA